MAGDWIKMRMELDTDPAVMMIANCTELDLYAVVGRLHKLWSWADAHTASGRIDGVFGDDIDRLVTQFGFAEAMKSAGWLEIDQRGVLFPRFHRHNGKSAKDRGLRAIRQANLRLRKSGAARATKAPPEPNRSEPIRSELKPDRSGGTNVLVGPAPNRGGMYLTQAAFLDRFLVNVSDALKLSSHERQSQKRSIYAVGRRLWKFEDKIGAAAQAIEMARSKVGVGLDSPIKAWQATVNEQWPKEIQC